MCKTTKRFISLFLTMVLLLGNFPMAGFAAETDTQNGADTVGAEFCVTAAPAVEMPGNEELFDYFVRRELYGQDMAVYGTAAGEKLNAAEQAIYATLKTNVETVAVMGGSTAFAVSGISGLKTVWSNKDLGVSSIEDLSAVGDAFEAQFVLEDITTALLHDCPLDLYWYDKTVGVRMNYQMEVSGYQDDSQIVWDSATVTDLVFTFAVSAEYESGANIVTTDVASIANVKNTAAQIVANNAGKSDYEKLVAYKDYICEAVSYNHAAADDDTTPYGNPWQLVYVFDGDGNTNVVCEGYSKAFQYLCDLTTFANGTACYTVSGQMDDGNHMWNIVAVGGSHYLVDVTNSDLGAVGQDGSLFLAGGNGSIGAGYTVSQCLYTYDAETVRGWGEAADSILEISDKNYTPGGEPLETPFTDVPAGAFYFEPVQWAVENGITNGTSATTFGSEDNCLRAHVVTFLHRAAGNPDPASTNNPFADVTSDGFFYKPVLWAVEKGITNGTSATTFGSYDNCNRAAVVTFLWRAAGSPEPTSTNNPFVDVNTTDFFYKAVLWAVENGITNGVDADHFGPTQSCNRAQVVTFLHRAN